MKTGKVGYKASYNGVCRDMKYEVGKTYTLNGTPAMCACGYHYCENIDNVFNYYTYVIGGMNIFEIEDLGTSVVGSDKTVTNKIKIVREIPTSEWSSLMTKRKFDESGRMVWYDDGVSISKWEYNENGRLIKYEDSNGGWKSYVYNKQDQVVRFDNNRGYWTLNTYDEQNHIIQTENSRGEITNFSYDNRGNMTTRKTDSNFLETWEYDSENRKTQYTNSHGVCYVYTYGKDEVYTYATVE